MANEKRLIDMTNVIEQRIRNHEKSICEKCSHRIVCRAIDNQPCFECNQFEQEVVRCKDCKHLTVYNSPTLYAYCQKTHLRFEPFQEDTRTHFCSYGERITE